MVKLKMQNGKNKQRGIEEKIMEILIFLVVMGLIGYVLVKSSDLCDKYLKKQYDLRHKGK